VAFRETMHGGTFVAMNSSVAGILQLIVAIAAILVATRALGALAVRLGQPAVVGQIIAGVILGASALKLVNPHDPIIHALGLAGALVLVFAAGLHTEPSALVRAGRAATSVALVGVILPFVLGYFATRWFGGTWIEGLMIGGALCATSAEISARVLARLGRLQSTEGRIVLGAAVIDDVIGLAVLAIVMSLVTSGSLTMESLIRTALLPAAFLAGLMIDSAGLNGRVDRVTNALSAVIVPFFFAVTGALLNVHAMSNARALGFAGALIVCAIAGKLIAGWAVRGVEADKGLIGVAMIPRGEMGLIFAQMGLAAGAIDQVSFGGILLMVIVTTLITAPALATISGRRPVAAVG
jgi:Kef-type K+ transport system membrane component KefB